MKHWSDSSEVVECGAMAPLHSGVKGDRVAPLCQPWATFHRSQVNPAFNSSSFFVLFVGARHAATAMKPWSVEQRQWSDGSDRRQGGAFCQPCGGNSRRQGATHELYLDLVKLEFQAP